MKKIILITLTVLIYNCSFSQVRVEYWNLKTKKSEGNYKNNKKDGKFTYWYDNGAKYAEGEYKNDLMKGKWSYFYKDGKKWKEVYIDSLFISWYNKGQKEKEACRRSHRYDTDGGRSDVVTHFFYDDNGVQ